MKDFDIKTPGEKIKDIRTTFNIKQEDLTGGEITRNLISIIENNKANLTESVANILASSINNICKERKIDYSVTADFLLETVVIQAKRIADEYINYINSIPSSKITEIKEKLNEIEYFLKIYKTEEKKCILYSDIGKKFSQQKMYATAFEYYIKAYENSPDAGYTTNILVRIGACCIYLSRYEEAIKYYSLLMNLNSEIQPGYLARFNIALCLKKLERYDEALEYLYGLDEDFKNTLPTSIKAKDIQMLIGVCLYKKKSFNKAIIKFKNLLKQSESIEEEVLVLTNLADVYSFTKDYVQLKKICDKIKDRLDKIDESEYQSDICISLSENLLEIGDNQSAEQLLFKALECFKNGISKSCSEDIQKIFLTLLTIFMKSNDKENIDFLRNEFFQLVQMGIIQKESLLTLKFIRHYNKMKDNNEVEEILSYLLD